MDSMDRGISRNMSSTMTWAPYIMLEQQFRMAPPLRQIVSHLYYHDRLEDGRNVESRGPNPVLKLKPLLIVNLTGTEMSFNRLHQSYENESEAAICKSIFDFIFSSEFEGVIPELGGEGLGADDVCILTPFNRHKDRLRMAICDVDEDDLDTYSGQTFGAGGSSGYSATLVGSPSKSQALYGTQDEVPENLAELISSIDTVDKFQGSERKVVIISTCVDRKPLRAADPHFINVACSRAQHLLVVVGNFSQALASNEHWRHVWEKAKEMGSYIDHAVSVVGLADKGTVFDIHEKELKSKLRELIESGNKRKRI